jgi:carboxypeptidase PM20D1
MKQSPLKLSIPSDVQIAENLSAAVRCQTVSFDDNSPPGPFLELHALLEGMYPLVHKTLKKEVISELSLLFTWQGSQADLPAIAFLAHQDVVPVVDGEAGWTYPAFSGTIANGAIWGRGVIDMKSQLITLLEAAEALLTAGFQPKRTIYLAFGHDEEVGGGNGARMIARTLQERGIQLDALMDEGGGVAGGMAPGIQGLMAVIAYAEKSFANVRLEVTANAGHASTPRRTSAIGILSRAITRLEKHPMPASLEFVRPTIQALLPHLPLPLRAIFGSLWLTGGIVKTVLAQEPVTNAMLRNTIAPTILQCGYKSNVLPEKASAVLNCRLLPGQGVDELLTYMRKVIHDPRVSVTCTDTSAPSKRPVSIQTPWYYDLESNITDLFGPVPICPMLMTGASDARHYQDLCSCIYRFTPFTFHMPEDDRTHGVDERIEINQLPVMVEFNAGVMQTWGSRRN